MTRMRLVAALATLSVLGGCIQDRMEVETITLDYLTNTQAAALAKPYLSAEGTVFFSDAALNTITVRDRRDNVRRVESLLGERDASPRNVSLHFQVVRATEAGAVDPELARVGNALRELLRFEGYELVSQAVVSASERRVVEQSLSGGAFPLQLGVRINDIVGGSGSVDMQVDLRRPGYPSLLATNVVVPMGQTVVLGSAYPGAASEALILTVRGELGSTKLRTSSRRTHEDVDAAEVRAEVAAQAAAEAEMLAREQAALEAVAADMAALEAQLSKDTREKVEGVDRARVTAPMGKAVAPLPARTNARVPPDGEN